MLLNATMGYVQESRAEAAVAALRAMSAADATVIRDGERRSVPASEIVPGDIILIEEGDTIPADAPADRVDRAADGGGRADRREPAGVRRIRLRSPRRCALGDRDNMVFSGTAATYGHGKAVVTATGMRTEMGRIAGLLKETPRGGDAAAAGARPRRASFSAWSSSPSPSS